MRMIEVADFADLEKALKLEPGNLTIEDELARLIWAEEKAQVSG